MHSFRNYQVEGLLILIVVQLKMAWFEPMVPIKRQPTVLKNRFRDERSNKKIPIPESTGSSLRSLVDLCLPWNPGGCLEQPCCLYSNVWVELSSYR